MILFIYGGDTFSSREKLDSIKQKYIGSAASDFNLLILDGKNATLEEIFRQCQALPFLANKRLVILKNFLESSKKEVQERMVSFLEKLPETTILVFYEEGVPDKRLALFKKLNLKNHSQEFALLSKDKLNFWIKERVQDYGGTIDGEAIETLAQFIGPNLWRMDNEIQKLLAFKSRINHEMVSDLIRPEISSDIFAAIDFLGQKNKAAALKAMHNLRENSENELYIFSMIAYQFRNLLLVKDMVLRTNNQYALAKNLGLHPFVISKALSSQRKFSYSELKKIYRSLLDFDWQMKLGKIEPKVALDLMVIKITEKI